MIDFGSDPKQLMSSLTENQEEWQESIAILYVLLYNRKSIKEFFLKNISDNGDSKLSPWCSTCPSLKNRCTGFPFIIYIFVQGSGIVNDKEK